MLDVKNLNRIIADTKLNNLNEPIYLVGATKTVSIPDIQTAIDNGLKIVAENKVQEFREKHGKIFSCTEHFIGHLQKNKVKYLVGNVDVIQSVDTISLAEEIDKYALKKGIVQKILVEINIAKEETKSGFYPEDLNFAINKIGNLKNVKTVGLMAMLPDTQDSVLLAQLCDKLREYYDKLNENNYNLKYLSVGMSNDYKIAINHGSNMIRLGSAIFGKRNYGEIK